jgi:hypothetical protein
MILRRTGLCLVIFIALFALVGSIASADNRAIASSDQVPFTEYRLSAGGSLSDSEYGRSVAMDGDLVAVGAGGDGAVGAVYLYKRNGMIYVFQGKLGFPEEVPETCPGDFEVCPEFGRTVAIHGDTVMVGARFAPVGDLRAGAVYVFNKHGNSWQYTDKIVSPTPQAGDNFGRALAVRGGILVVTARKTVDEEGAAYIFDQRGDRWSYQTTLSASDPTPGAYFGQSVDIQGDIIAIGARDANPNTSGGIYLFRQSGHVWTEIAKVIPQDGQADDQYGFAIAMSGNTIVVGARRADLTATKTNTGAVYVYSLKGNLVEPVIKLIPGDVSKGDEFGQSVAVAGDVIAVGAWKDDNKQGSIYLFRRMGDQWIETDRITASDGLAGDEFGYSLSAYGNRIVTGAHKADSLAGAAYIITIKP